MGGRCITSVSVHFSVGWTGARVCFFGLCALFALAVSMNAALGDPFLPARGRYGAIVQTDIGRWILVAGFAVFAVWTGFIVYRNAWQFIANVPAFILRRDGIKFHPSISATGFIPIDAVQIAYLEKYRGGMRVFLFVTHVVDGERKTIWLLDNDVEGVQHG